MRDHDSLSDIIAVNRAVRDNIIDEAPDYRARILPDPLRFTIEQILVGIEKFVVFLGDGPGAGRTFFMEQLMTRYPDQIGILPLHMTRARRNGEIEGIHGHFMGPKSKQAFRHLEESDFFFLSFQLGIAKRKKLAGISMHDMSCAIDSSKIWLIDMPAYAIPRFSGVFNRTRIVLVTAPPVDHLRNLRRRGFSDSQLADCYWQNEIGTCEPVTLPPVQPIVNKRCRTEANMELLREFVLDSTLPSTHSPPCLSGEENESNYIGPEKRRPFFGERYKFIGFSLYVIQNSA